MIEAFRLANAGKGTYTTAFRLGYNSAVTLMTLVFGIVIFRKTETNSVNTV